MLVIVELLPETVVIVQIFVDDPDKLPEPDCRENNIDEPAHTLCVLPGIWVGRKIVSLPPTNLTHN